MADADDVRRLALALPHVEEIDSDGFDFRVCGKGFVWSYPERKPGKPRVIRTDIAVLFVGDEAEKQALLLGEPRLFFTAPGYDGWPLVMLRLAEVDTARLTELVTDAWRMRAPADIASELEQADGLPGAGEPDHANNLPGPGQPGQANNLPGPGQPGQANNLPGLGQPRQANNLPGPGQADTLPGPGPATRPGPAFGGAEMQQTHHPAARSPALTRPAARHAARGAGDPDSVDPD